MLFGYVKNLIKKRQEKKQNGNPEQERERQIQEAVNAYRDAPVTHQKEMEEAETHLKSLIGAKEFKEEKAAKALEEYLRADDLWVSVPKQDRQKVVTNRFGKILEDYKTGLRECDFGDAFNAAEKDLLAMIRKFPEYNKKIASEVEPLMFVSSDRARAGASVFKALCQADPSIAKELSNILFDPRVSESSQEKEEAKFVNLLNLTEACPNMADKALSASKRLFDTGKVNTLEAAPFDACAGLLKKKPEYAPYLTPMLDKFFSAPFDPSVNTYEAHIREEKMHAALYHAEDLFLTRPELEQYTRPWLDKVREDVDTYNLSACLSQVLHGYQSRGVWGGARPMQIADPFEKEINAKLKMLGNAEKLKDRIAAKKALGQETPQTGKDAETPTVQTARKGQEASAENFIPSAPREM